MKKAILILSLTLLALILRAQPKPDYPRTRTNQVLSDYATLSRYYFGLPTGGSPSFPSYVPDSLKCKALFNVDGTGTLTKGLYRYNCSTNAWEMVGSSKAYVDSLYAAIYSQPHTYNSINTYNQGAVFNNGSSIYAITANGPVNFNNGGELFGAFTVNTDWQYAIHSRIVFQSKYDVGNNMYIQHNNFDSLYTPSIGISQGGSSVALYLTNDNIYRRVTPGSDYTSGDPVLWSSQIPTVQTIAQMIAYTGPSTVIAVGDTTRGDIFDYNASSTANDGGISFTATGKGAGSWIRQRKPGFYNVLWYGVDNTGTTNDSTQVAEIVNGADSLAVIYFPNGIYSGNITLSKPMHLVGQSQPIYNNVNLSGGTIIKGNINLNAQRGASVEMLGIDQTVTTQINGIQNSTDYTMTPFITTPLYNRIENVTLAGSGYAIGSATQISQHGIYLIAGANNIVNKVNIYKYAHGIAAKSSRTSISNVYSQDNFYEGLIVKSDSAHADVADVNLNNIILNSANSGIAGIIIQSYAASAVTERVNISNVTSYKSNENAIIITQNAGIVRNVNVVNATSHKSTLSAFKVLSPATNIKFTNCEADTSGTYSFENAGGTFVSAINCTSVAPTTADYTGSWGPFSLGNDFSTVGKIAAGIQISTTTSRLHILESTNLGSTAGNYQIVSTISGTSGSNIVKHNEGMYRLTAGTSFTTSQWYDWLSVDGSYTTPGVNGRVYWGRDPNAGSQFFGDGATTYLSLNSTRATVPALRQTGLTTAFGINYLTNTSGDMGVTAQGPPGTVLHGNGATIPSFTQIQSADLASGISYASPTFTGTSLFNSKINVSTAANGPSGTLTLVAGTATISNTSVTVNSIIYLSHKTNGGTVGTYSYTTSAGIGFTITSTSSTDTSTLGFEIHN